MINARHVKSVTAEAIEKRKIAYWDMLDDVEAKILDAAKSGKSSVVVNCKGRCQQLSYLLRQEDYEITTLHELDSDYITISW